MATVTLTWNAPASGGPVTHYKIYRKAGSSAQTEAVIRANPDSGFPIQKTVAEVSSGSGFTYDDTTLSSGDGHHCWTVTAEGPGGESTAGATSVHETL